MVGLITLIVVVTVMALGLKVMLSGSPYGSGFMLPFGRFILTSAKSAKRLPWTEAIEPSTEKPKIPPATIAYLQGDLFLGRLAIVGILTLGLKGYLILRRDPENGHFTFIKKNLDAEHPATALTKSEARMLNALFPGDDKELVINRHSTARLDHFCALLLHSLDEKFAHRRRMVPLNLLVIGLVVSVVGQLAIAAPSQFGIASMALPIWLLLCPLLVIFFAAGLYTTLRSFYFRPFQHIAERLMVFGIGAFFSLIGWLMGLWIGLLAYGFFLLQAVVAVQAITVLTWLLARQPPKNSQNGHRPIAQIINALNDGHHRPDAENGLDGELLLLALATGTERIWLSGHHQPHKPDSSVLTATDKLVEAQSEANPETGLKSNARKLDQRLLKLFQKIQGMVPVRGDLDIIHLPEWLDLTPDSRIEPDALANILGELLVMELAFNLILIRNKRHSSEKYLGGNGD